MEARPTLHPSAEILRALALGELTGKTASEVRSHLDSCPTCRAEVAAATNNDLVRGMRPAHDATQIPAQSFAETVRPPTPPPGPTTLFNLPPELSGNPDYEILRELGRGGMGVVYQARHKLSGRLEVLKVMNKALIGQPESRERFLREIQAAARLDHRNIVRMYTALERGELMVLVIEYVEGEDLARVVKARGPLSVLNACYYVQQTAAGLQHAFEKGMVHRDIKPQNLMLIREGKRHTVKVLDFGLAKATRSESVETGLTGTGAMMGTPGYVAPEQSLDAAKADIRADVYSLGCTLYHLLTGAPPFTGKSLFEILQAHHSTDARPLNLVRPEVPQELAAVVGKMMAKDPAARYQTPAQVMQALDPFIKSGPTAPQTVVPAKKKPNLATPEVQALLRQKTVLAETQRVAAGGLSKPLPGSTPSKGGRQDAAGERKTAGGTRSKKWLVGVTAALVLMLGVIGLWASGVFKVKTKNGTIVLENVPADAEVSVDGGIIELRVSDGKTLTIQVAAGRKHQLQVKKEGFKVFGEEVEIASGTSRSIVVRLQPEPVVAQAPPTPDAKKQEPPVPVSRPPVPAPRPQPDPDKPTPTPEPQPSAGRSTIPSPTNPPRPPKKEDPRADPSRAAGGIYRRRALVISIHDYLYANPIQNGPSLPNAHNYRTFLESLNRGLNIPLNQIAHLSDVADTRWGSPRAPTKTVIEKTLTSFLDSSRAQDRILVFFVGHSVEMEDGVYLAPIEGELDKADTLIPLKWFYDQMAKCKARQKVLVLDINRYNPVFGQERPGGDQMGAKLDDMLKAPPAGVQVWSACVAKQRSYATDEYPMGLFLEEMQTIFDKRRLELPNVEQAPDQSLPLAPIVERINQHLKTELSKRKLEQQSHLSGEEAKLDLAYNGNDPPASDAASSLAGVPEDVAINKALIEMVFDQVGTPPVKVGHELAMRYDALPPFPVEALQKYQGDAPNPDSPLRKAVKHTRAVLWAIYPGGTEPKELTGDVTQLRTQIRFQLNVLKEGYRGPPQGGNEMQFKSRVARDERAVALIMFHLNEALENMTSKEVVEARETETKRWKANYDFMLARLQLECAHLFEYQSMLGTIRKEFPPRDPAISGGWKLASIPMLRGDIAGKKFYKSAQKLLDKIIKENAGSPWEVLARREKLTNLGLEWQAVR